MIPKSFEKVLECVRKRENWNDLKYVEISCRLGAVTPQELKNVRASWHSDCYKECTHKANMARSERLCERQLFEPLPSPSSNDDMEIYYTTRSQIPKFDKSKHFFCNVQGTRRNKMFKIATYSASIRLKRAVNTMKC